MCDVQYNVVWSQGLREPSIDAPADREAVTVATRWKWRLDCHRRRDASSSDTNNMGLRKMSQRTPPPALTHITPPSWRGQSWRHIRRHAQRQCDTAFLSQRWIISSHMLWTVNNCWVTAIEFLARLDTRYVCMYDSHITPRGPNGNIGN